MNPTTLAELSNTAVYSAALVLTFAMVAHALYLARVAPERSAAEAPSRSAVADRELVAVSGASASGGPVTVDAASGPMTADPGSTGSDDDPVAPGAEPVGASPTGAEGESRMARQSAGVARTLTLLGTALLVVGVVLRAAEVGRWPLGNMYEFALVGSMSVLVVYSAWATRRDLRWLGLFVVGPVLVNLGLAIAVWYTDASELVPSLRSVWLAIHVSVAVVAVALFTIGFSLGILYLVQERLESRGGTSSFMGRLPGSRALERLTYSAHVVAFPLWTFTVIAGAIWARQAWGAYWNWDPKEVWSFVIWVVYAAYLHARATTGMRRSTAVWIALAGFGCVIVNFTVVNVFLVGMHSYSGL
ncbi:MAG: c-type cytochrome biogenesis protein CcsB [Dermatophilaceae bacterium]